jgi:hypothetical protein
MNPSIQQLKDAKLQSLQEPEWFFANILNETLDPWQLTGIEAIADVHRFIRGEPTVINHEGLNRISITSCHGPGKTHWLAQIMHWWNWCFYGLVVCTAPKEGQLKTRLWPRYRKILRGAIPEYSKLIRVSALTISVADYIDGRFVFDEDWGCIAETAADPENMAGYHDTTQLILVDEASSKRLDPMFPVLEGTLTTPGSCLAQIGNPTRSVGEFYNAHNKAIVKKLFFDMHIVPNVRKKELQLQSPSKNVFGSDRVDEKWLLNMEQKYGADSPIVKVRAYGLFADMEENQLIALAWLEDAKDIEEVTDGSLPRLKVSIDVADGGLDFSVITVAKEYDSFTQMVAQFKYNFPSSESPILVAKKGIDLFLQYGGDKNSDTLVVDSIGVGAGTAGYIIEKGYNVKCHKGGSTVGVDTKKFRNQRTMAYCSFRDMHRDVKIRYSPGFCDDWDEYVAQVCSIKSAGTERVDDIETKKSLIDRGVKSPDRGDSASMLCSPSKTRISTLSSLNSESQTMVSANTNW